MSILKSLVLLKIRNDFILRALNYIAMSDIIWTPKQLEVSPEDFIRINEKPKTYKSIYYDIKDGYFCLTRPESLGVIGQLFYVKDVLWLVGKHDVNLTDRIYPATYECENFTTPFSYLEYVMSFQPQSKWVVQHIFLKITNNDEKVK